MLTEDQQLMVDKVVMSLTAQFEAANERLARIKAIEPDTHRETAAQQSSRAAAERLPDGSIPDGILVMENGKAVMKSREAAIIELKQGSVTLN